MSELDSEEVVLVCMLRHLENDVYRKVQGGACKQAGIYMKMPAAARQGKH